MKLILNGIGIIDNCSIDLNGLTIITGKNKSGKTTIGKALYSILEGTNDVARFASIDKRNYIEQRLTSIFFRTNLLFGVDDSIWERIVSNPVLAEVPVFLSFLNSFLNDSSSNSFDYSIDSIEKMKQEITDIDYHGFKTELNSLLKRRKKEKEADSNREKDYILSELNQLIKTLEKNSDNDAYERLRINQILSTEFSKQIQPVKAESIKTSIELLSDSQEKLIEIEIEKNQVSRFKKQKYSFDEFNPFFIDNAHLLDRVMQKGNRRYFPFASDNAEFEKWISSQSSVWDHGTKLLNTILVKKGNLFEQTVLSSEYDDLVQKLNLVVPGDFESEENGFFYHDGSIKLNVDNLATGSKLFSIIKLLMKNGKIMGNTFLIFDEPEAHLHPEWQNSFAELIISVVKEIGANVLLTTHSPNLTLAFDAFMRKYQIIDKVNFYKMENLPSSEMMACRNVNEDIGIIYDDFVESLAEMKALRDKFFSDGSSNYDD